MSNSSGYQADPGKIERESSARALRRRKDFWNWVGTRFAVRLAGGFLLAIVAGAIFLDAPSGARGHVTLYLVLPLLLALVFTVGNDLIGSGTKSLGAEAIALEAEKEWRELVEPGWLVRMLKLALLMAAVIGLGVGAVLAATLPENGLLAGSRILTIIGFTFLTVLWTTPAVLTIRVLRVRDLRRYARD